MTVSLPTQLRNSLINVYSSVILLISQKSVKHCRQYLNSDARSFASWLNAEGNGAIKLPFWFSYWITWDKQKYPTNFEVGLCYHTWDLRTCYCFCHFTRISTELLLHWKHTIPDFSCLLLQYRHTSLVVYCLYPLASAGWLLALSCLLVSRPFCACVFFSGRRQYWVCRYLPNDNRNMMISRSSGRSGFIYMVNVY